MYKYSPDIHCQLQASLIHSSTLGLLTQALTAAKIVEAQLQQLLPSSLLPSSSSSWQLTRSRTVCNALSISRRALHTRLGDFAFKLPSFLIKHRSSDPIQDLVASTIASAVA